VRRICLIVGAVLFLGLAAASSSAAAPPSGQAFIDRTLTIRTVPAVEGLRFAFRGQIYRSNAAGRVRLPHAAVIAREPPRPLDGRLEEDVRVRFARYFGDQHSGLITATYDIDYRVSFDFTDLVGHPIAPAEIKEMTYRNSIGFRDTVRNLEPKWLQGARVVPESAQRLAIKNILYRIERVVVRGTNVVNRAEQSFEPRFKGHVSVQLLYYTASFSARDAFFGFKTGSSIKITYPDGTVERYPLGSDGKVTVPSLPRGEYDVTVEGGGIPISRPLSLSTNSNLQIEVLSYFDIAVVVAMLLLFVIGLPLIRRPHLVRRPLRWLTGRRAAERSAARMGDSRSAGDGQAAHSLTDEAGPAAAPTNGGGLNRGANGARSGSERRGAASARSEEPR
jgi:hypothetical protein